jgi:hypothetical protein
MSACFLLDPFPLGLECLLSLLLFLRPPFALGLLPCAILFLVPPTLLLKFAGRLFKLPLGLLLNLEACLLLKFALCFGRGVPPGLFLKGNTLGIEGIALALLLGLTVMRGRNRGGDLWCRRWRNGFGGGRGREVLRIYLF